MRIQRRTQGQVHARFPEGIDVNPGLVVWVKFTPYVIPVLCVLLWLAFRGDLQWIVAGKTALGWVSFGAGLSVGSAFWTGRW